MRDVSTPAKKGIQVPMPCRGQSLHFQKSLNASYEMKIKPLPPDYITLQFFYGLSLLLIEL